MCPLEAKILSAVITDGWAGAGRGKTHNVVWKKSCQMSTFKGFFGVTGKSLNDQLKKSTSKVQVRVRMQMFCHDFILQPDVSK